MAYWIWYPGRFRDSPRNVSRFLTGRSGDFWPGFWKRQITAGLRSSSQRKCMFRKELDLPFMHRVGAMRRFAVWKSGGSGSGGALMSRASRLEQRLHAVRESTGSRSLWAIRTGLPCVIIDSEEIHTDGSWMAEDMAVLLRCARDTVNGSAARSSTARLLSMQSEICGAGGRRKNRGGSPF